MPEDPSSATCQHCGNSVQPGDKFCGSCGAVNLPPPPQAERVVPEPHPRAQGTSYAPRRRKRFWINAAAISLLLLVSVGAVSAFALNGGLGLLGSSDPQPAGDRGNEPAPKEEAENPEVASVSPDAPPAPAFDLLLPALKNLTTAPIMLPAELENEFDNVGIEAGLEGDRYELTFLTTPPEELVGTWGNYETIGSLEAIPASEFEPDQRFEATSTEDVKLPDGTEAKLRYMEPVQEEVMFGPHWEGTFDKNGYTYSLEFDDYGKEIVEQALSTMVLVRGSVADSAEGSTETTGSEPTAPSNDFQIEAERAAGDYYRAAGSQDWDYTYDALDSETQSMFTREEWSQKNQWFADNAPAIYDIESAELDDTAQEPLAEVTVRLTGEDGSSSVRTTYFVYEDGEWKHRFGQEETDLFEPGVPFEEWVNDQ